MAGNIELYEDKAGEYRFRLKLRSGQIVLGSEGYKKRSSAENAIMSVIKNARNSERYVRKVTKSGKHIFNLTSANGQVIGTSERYESASARDNVIEAIRYNAPDALVNDLTSNVFDGLSAGSRLDNLDSNGREKEEPKGPAVAIDTGVTSPQDKSRSDQEHARMEGGRKSGFGLHFTRESQEIALNGKSFALALARLFRNAEGEFSFALLGRWGSGKTSIANLVSGFLEDPLSYKSDFQSVFGSDADEDCDKLEYKTVKFNAWRYRQKPELWVYLYESFLVEFLDCNIFERITKTVRVNLLKVGVFQALFSLLVLALSAFPLMWISLVFPYANTVFGVAGSIGLVLLAYRWRASLRHLYDRYGVIKSHREHLGMQAVIGYDLQVLLKSWSKTDHFKTWEKTTLGVGTLLVSLVWLSTFGASGSVSTASLFGWLIWSLIGGVFWASAVFKIGSVDRIFLVIDDLDRCPEEEIVDLIDGIKLMIDDEAIGKVVQALVLADDTVLVAAVSKRFEALSSEENDARWIEAINEHMEKVFLCHAHLPKLTESDVVDLVGVYSQEFGLEALATNHQDASDSSSVADSGETILSADENQIARQTDFVITQAEQAAIRQALKRAFDTTKAPITPRFVRSFLYKYQLVRMLLQLNGVEFETSELTSSLIEAVLWARSSVTPWKPKVTSQSTSFIRMVA